jgi:hypothetical protein
MAQTKDLRLRATVADTPDAGVARFYADSNGVLKVVTPAGTVYDAAGFYATTNAVGVVASGTSVFLGGAGMAVTGIAFGTTGSFIRNSFLGAPNAWVSVNISGTAYSVPAYART